MRDFVLAHAAGGSAQVLASACADQLRSAEGCAFEWVGGAGHPRFKDVSRLVQDRMKQMAAQ